MQQKQKKNMTFSLDTTVIDKLRFLEDNTGISMSSHVKQAINKYCAFMKEYGIEFINDAIMMSDDEFLKHYKRIESSEMTLSQKYKMFENSMIPPATSDPDLSPSKTERIKGKIASRMISKPLELRKES
jgi:hypothetical protein